MTVELDKIQKQNFYRCFHQWQEKFSKCVCSEVSYFEANKGNGCLYSGNKGLHEKFGDFLRFSTRIYVYAKSQHNANI